MAGLSRAARDGVVVRDGGGLEALGRARTLLVDKTGTLTLGRPSASETVTAPGVDRGEVLRLAASLEQLSQHVLAAAVVREAQSHGVTLSTPTDVTEQPGSGVTGRVDDRRVSVGQLAGQPPPWAEQVRRRAELDGASIVWVSIDDTPAAALVMRDPVIPMPAAPYVACGRPGFNRLIMLTGDRPRVAAEVARVVGADDTVARCGPDQKAERVRAESGRAVTVMVGDGVNDAPALAEANVGVAIGGTGATASAEVADAVLTVDRLDRLADVVEIARRSRRIAVQNATGGMGLALVAMGFAAAGFLPPVAGAFLQEGIDLLVILNALRALGGGVRRQPLPPQTQELMQQFAAEHQTLHDALSQLHTTADHIATDPDAPERVTELRDTHRRLTEQVLTHEDAEEHRLYPAMTAPLGGEATGTMSRTHVEIHRLVDRIGGHLDQISDSRLHTDQLPDLLATLYGLDAVLRLHSTEEEEEFFSLTAGGNPVRAPGT